MIKINVKKVIKSRNVALTILMIIACSLLTGSVNMIIPSLLFVGIIGAMKKEFTLNETLLGTFIAFVAGSIISMIISLISVYYYEGALFAILVVRYAWVYVLYYTFIGCVGGALGYYVKEEMKEKKLWN